MKTRVALNDENLVKVAGGSYDFNHDTGILNVGDMEHASRYQITHDDFDEVQRECDAIFDADGSDAEKNAAVIELIEGNNWGTLKLRV